MSSPKVQNTYNVANGQQQHAQISTTAPALAQGDLNNTSSMRQIEEIRANPEFAYRSLAIPTEEDDPDTLAKYRPFLLDDAVASQDWVAKLELATATEMSHADIIKTGERLKVLVLYGSLRNR
jgi:arsenic resistance protein ArsH